MDKQEKVIQRRLALKISKLTRDKFLRLYAKVYLTL